ISLLIGVYSKKGAIYLAEEYSILFMYILPFIAITVVYFFVTMSKQIKKRSIVNGFMKIFLLLYIFLNLSNLFSFNLGLLFNVLNAIVIVLIVFIASEIKITDLIISIIKSIKHFLKDIF
ncbi:MAG TPA: hypothetical protein DHS57_02940, partial [Erysipelotrichaceae bacterium]|nr:hypothetical protein [Erysipelotrichaceae bacterium]